MPAQRIARTTKKTRSRARAGRAALPVEPLESRRLLAGQLFISSANDGTIGAYGTTGATINATLVSGLSFQYPYGMAVSGGDVFVSDFYAGTISEYTTAGAVVNASLVTGLNTGGTGPFGIAISGSQLFVTIGNGGSTVPTGSVGEYTLGATPGTITSSVPALITGLSDAGSVAVSGTTLFVGDYALGRVGSYTTAGAPINANLVTGLDHPEDVAVVGSDLFVTEQGNAQRIGKYTTSGATVNANFVPNLNDPLSLVAAGNDLFVDTADNVVAEYTTAGAVVNATLLSGLNGPFGMAIAPPVSTAAQEVFAPAPAGGLVGSLPAVKVNLEDTSGTPIANDDSAVTLSIVSGPAGATLGGTTTVSAVNGVATFADLSLATPGTYVLQATDGTVPAVTTAPFTIAVPVVKTIGGLDPAFGSGGLASHDVGFTATTGVAADGAQSVLVGPAGAAPTRAFGVTRYNADGSLDTAFGTAGIVDTAFAGTDAVPAAVAVLANGEIIVAGTATTYATDGTVAGSQFAVAEYTAAGALDASFGTGGQVLVSFATGATSTDVLRALAVGPGGVLYLGGSSDAAGQGNADFAVAALTPAGALVTAFGTGGKVLTDVAGGDDAINGLAVQAKGADLVAAGSAVVGGVTQVALARYLPSGGLDAHFGIKGLATAGVGGVYDAATSVAIQAKGQIVVGGLTASGSGASLSSDFLIQRYTTAGKLDRTFAAGGTAKASFGQPSAVTQVVAQADGSVVASGRTSATLGGTLDVAVARFTSRGALDVSFNATGKVIVGLAGTTVTGNALRAADVTAAAAVDLGAAFDAFTSSQQGVVAVTSGGEILTAGNSGANTVEAELIAAGVDLVAKILSSLPASVLGGLKATATVTVTETGTTKASGTVTVTVAFAADTAGTGAVTVKTLATKVNLGQGQSKAYKVPFNYPAGLPSGGYYLLATVTEGAGLAADLNTANNTIASNAPVSVAPPFVSLSGSGLAAASPFAAGASATVSLDVTNAGNVPAKGKTDVVVYLSTDGTLATATQVGDPALAVGLSAGKARVYKLKVALPSTVAAGTYTLLAVIDPNRSLGSTDQTVTSAVVVADAQVTVG